MDDPLKPKLQLLVKLGSIAIHAEEMMSLDAHTFDQIALTNILNDYEVREWLNAMGKMAMLPVKRK